MYIAASNARVGQTRQAYACLVQIRNTARAVTVTPRRTGAARRVTTRRRCD